MVEAAVDVANRQQAAADGNGLFRFCQHLVSLLFACLATLEV
jgi:hypothetical protein